jgi:hypothetical protein
VSARVIEGESLNQQRVLQVLLSQRALGLVFGDLWPYGKLGEGDGREPNLFGQQATSTSSAWTKVDVSSSPVVLRLIDALIWTGRSAGQCPQSALPR